MATLEHHRIDLTAAERQRLEELAVLTRSRPTRGTAAYQWSWKTMLRRIGNGEIDLVERNPYALPDWLDEAADAVEAEQAAEQARLEEQRRVEQHMAQKQAVQKMPLKMEQMNMPLELEPA